MKSQSYMTRALTARDPRFARVLGKLGYQRDDVVASASVATETETDTETETKNKPKRGGDNLASLRDRYKEVVGKRAFHGWGADDLRKKITAHKAGR